MIHIKIFRIKQYFIKGHREWLVWPIWLLSSITTFYVLLLSEFPNLKQLFGNIIIFGLFYACLYFPLAIIIGYWEYHFKDTGYTTMLKLEKENSPIWNPLFKKLDKQEEELKCIKEELKLLKNIFNHKL